MSEIEELYQEMILDHSRSPRNFGKPEKANREARGLNPLCGDDVTVYLELSGDRIEDIGFLGNGCAISKASASLMTAAVKGKRLEEVEAIFQSFHRLLTGEPGGEVASPELGKLEVFSGVRRFLVRVKCATLAWHTLRAAVEGRSDPVTTEA